MAYVRVSLMKPMKGRDAEVLRLNRELVEFYREQAGCAQSHYLRPATEGGQHGRVSFWASEATADAAATLDHSMFLRSRLHLIVRKGHEELSFYDE